MKIVIPALLALFVSTAFIAGCDEEQAADESDEPVAQADEATDEEDSPVDDIQPADGEVVEDDEDVPELDALEGVQWLENDHYGVKVQVPADWEISQSDDVVSATDPTDSTTAIIGGSETDETLQNAIDGLKDEIEFSDVEVQTSDPKTLGGFPAHEGIGSALMVREDDIDQEIQFLGYAINIGDNENVVLMIFSEAAMYEAMRDTIHGIANTISRI